MCDKEYLLEVGQAWVGLMTCPHEIEHHILKEVIDDDTDGGNRKLNTHDTQHD